MEKNCAWPWKIRARSKLTSFHNLQPVKELLLKHSTQLKIIVNWIILGKMIYTKENCDKLKLICDI